MVVLEFGEITLSKVMRTGLGCGRMRGQGLRVTSRILGMGGIKNWDTLLMSPMAIGW